MSRDDERLKALFALDEPPARDAGFSTEVMARVMRRRFLEDVAFLCVLTLAGALGLWILWPVLQPTLVSLSRDFAPAVGAVALGVCVWIVVSGRPGAAPMVVS
jgi:hypothetical protein